MTVFSKNVLSLGLSQSLSKLLFSRTVDWLKISILAFLTYVLLLSSSVYAAQVNVLNSASTTATGSGTTGIPSLSGFNIPAGKNRVLFIWAAFERDHCTASDACTAANTAGTGLGDNWPEPRIGTPPTTTTNNQITATVVGSGSSISKKNALTIGGTPSGDLRFQNMSSSPSGSPTGTAFFSASSFHVALFEDEINALLGGSASGNVSISLPDVVAPNNAGDDAILIASVYENVEQTAWGMVRNATGAAQLTTVGPPAFTVGNYAITVSTYDASPGAPAPAQTPDEADDGKLVMALSTSTEGFLTPAGHTLLANVAATNNNGVFDTTSAGGYDINEPNGFSANMYFRTGGTTPSSGYTITSAAASTTRVYGGFTQSYLLESDNADTSDAPSSYGHPTHAISGIRLGASVDADAAILANSTATGDDTNSTDDENGVTMPASLATGQMASILVNIQNVSGVLNVWFDWNKDGDFLDSGEQVVSEQAVATGTTNLNIAVPATASGGTTFARFRACSTTAQCNTPTSAASTGEVEDYAATIIAPMDYSDAPATYGTPSHTIVSGVRLGATAPDNEAAAQPSTGANLDDTTGTDDEDGITLPTLTQGQTASITATVAGAGGYLQGWIDFNGDGDFADSGEQVATNIQDNTGSDTNATAGSITFSVNVPAGAVTTQTYARFRWSSTSGLNSTAVANDGEVEDYVLTVTAATTVPNTLPVIPGAPALTCPSIITNGDFENANSGDYWAPQRSGAVALNSWSATGGGTDSYSSIITGSTAINSKSLYFGNGGVKSVAPALSSGFTYDANLLATNTPSIITIRNSSDDVATVSGASPGTTTQCCDYGGQPISAQQTFTTTVGQTYRLRFSTKGEGGSGMAGILKIEAPGGSAHVRVPAVNQPADHYTFEFTATAATSTIRFTNYGHFYQDNGGFCDPNNSGFCTVNGLAGGQQSSEAVLDDVQVAAISCATDRSDAPIATTSYGEALHFISTGMQLGASIDNDPSTIANTAANGDGADDDGVTLPALMQGQTATITATVTGTGGYLQAWIDWNGNGDFADAGEQIATNLQYSAGSSGTINLPITVPVSATTNKTYARFRWSSISNLSATAAAIDGEVEDYAITVAAPLVYPAAASEAECPVAAGAVFTPSYQVGWNHGGADPYASTLQASDIASAQSITAGSGISYLIDSSTGRILNASQSGRVNAYQAGDYAQYSFTTSASVSAGRFWKGLRYGVMSTASIHTPYKISVLASTDPSFTTATLLLDGHTVTAPASGYIQTVVPFTASTYLLPSTTYYVRIIFHDVTSSSGELRWDDLVLGFSDCHDYSDAPITATSYGSAAHAVVSGGDLRLGGDIDAENTGLASTNADGDDTMGLDDEDSLSSLPSLSTSSRQYSLNLPVSNLSGSTARLVGWIDFNRNGVLDNNEATTTNIANGISNKVIGMTWPMIPADIQAGISLLRLRLTTDASIATGTASTSQATGLAFDGEVEDYVLTISNGGVSVSGTVYHDLNVDGIQQAEPGIGQVTIVLYDSANNSCRSTQTNAQGQYHFDQVAAGNYTVYEAAAEALPQPNTCPPVGADLNAYLSSTPNNQALTVSTASINGLDFADVQKPQFTLEHSQTTLPGATVTYPHRFTALADGTVSFSLADGADPANLTWDVVLYVDTNCNAALEGGDTELNSAFLMTAGQSLCLIAKVLAPSNVSSGASHILEITSSFTFGDGSRISTPVTQTRTDLTRTSAGSPTGGTVDGAGKLKLSKAVWNVSRNIQGDVALPGETLRYLISYENIGNGSLDELAVQDRVPEFTSLTGLPQCGTTPPELTLCSPTVGGLDLEWVFTGKLLPGARGQVFYEVLVE